MTTRLSTLQAEFYMDIIKFTSHPDNLKSDGTTKSIHSKVAPTLRLCEENVGNILQLFARWINTKHPDLAGPWTGPIAEIIG